MTAELFQLFYFLWDANEFFWTNSYFLCTKFQIILIIKRLAVNNVSVVLIGLSGYGAGYARLLIEQGPSHNAQLVGIADPYAEKNPYWPVVREQKIPRYDDLRQFVAHHRADLAAIASPIHLHCPQTCDALRAGYHVLCEKPAAGTIQDVQRMIAAREKTGKFAAVGYNWSFSEEIQALKRDVMAGLFGRPVRLKTIVLWSRGLAYYHRNNWAGKLRMPDGGDWVLDSPVNNAAAHYLHNMFYILGSAVDNSAMPAEVVAELYRANDIANYDTAALRAKTNDGVEVLFIASHAVEQSWPVRFEFVFELSKVEFEGSGLRAVFNDGRVRDYVIPAYNQSFNKLWQCIDAVRAGGNPVCGLEAAMAQTLCMNGAQESMPQIAVFPPAMVQRQKLIFGKREPEDYVVATGLADALQACYKFGQLPSERGLSWAKAGRRVDLRAYEWYPGGKRP